MLAIVSHAGELKAKYRYRVFGEQLTVEAPLRSADIRFDWTNLAFTGHEKIPDTPFIHMGGRTYHVALGRFMQTDILNVDHSNPISFNRYAYVLNNPLGYVDPTGYAPQPTGEDTNGDVGQPGNETVEKGDSSGDRDSQNGLHNKDYEDEEEGTYTGPRTYEEIDGKSLVNVVDVVMMGYIGGGEIVAAKAAIWGG